MRVQLLPDLELFVAQRVKAGQYASASEVVNGALALFQAQERWVSDHVPELRRAVAVGLEELDRGEGEPWDVQAIKAEGRRQLAAKRRRERRRKQLSPRKEG